jgi:GR25 family glycosyltransferase involved in LPS biosynthesis
MANAFDEDESNMTQVSRVSIKAFLINVEDRTDRYKQSSSQLNQAKIPFTTIKAVTPESMRHIDIAIKNDVYIASMGQPANLISHLKTLHKFITNTEHDNKIALILEDDATPSPSLTFEKVLSTLKTAPNNFKILQLGTSHLQSAERLFNHRCKSGLAWHEWHYPFWGTHAYLITKEAAEKVVRTLFHSTELDLRSLYCPDLCISDFLLYLIRKTYTSTYPGFGQIGLESSIRYATTSEEKEMMQKRNQFLRGCWSNPPEPIEPSIGIQNH